MLQLLGSPEIWLSLVMLSLMEIVLGIDNLIFVSILSSRVIESRRDSARRLGMVGAFGTRLCLLAFIGWIATLTTPIFSVFEVAISGKSLILILGGLFLLYKSTTEIHHKLEGADEMTEDAKNAQSLSFHSVIMQIMLLDIVFSLDSVITAVGMSPHLSIMIAANAVALCVMLAVGGFVSRFIDRHPTIKVLALSFLLMIGLVLIGEGLGLHIPKGYIYFAMGFSIFVEAINIVARNRRKKTTPIHLRS
jgi:predicted tellurium resistance membrane protein TerC